jgi:hypothetical protein
MISHTFPPDLTLDDFCAISDALTHVIRELLAVAGGGVSVPIEQDFGYSRAVRQYEARLLAIPHYPTTSRLLQKAHGKTMRLGLQWVLDHTYDLIQDLSNVCAATELPVSTRHSNIVGYATHFNTGAGGPYRALLSRELADVFELLYRGTNIDPSNIYAPAIENMASRTVGSAAVIGEFIDSTRYAGAPIIARVQGYTGGPGMLTVIGSGRMAHGGVASDARVWSVQVGSSGEFELLPDVDGDLCLAVRDIGLPAPMTAGTVTIEGLLPERLR